jgi:hypothetical protein
LFGSLFKKKRRDEVHLVKIALGLGSTGHSTLGLCDDFRLLHLQQICSENSRYD